MSWDESDDEWCARTNTVNGHINGNTNSHSEIGDVHPAQSLRTSIGAFEESELLAAIHNNNLDQLKKVFVETCAPIDIVLRGGWTPLMHAASLFRGELCDFLLSSGANVEYQHNFLTPLLVLSSHQPLPDEYDVSVSCAKCLIVTHKANVNACDKFNTSPLLFAAINKHLQLIQLLVEQGCDVNHVDSRGFNALHHACFHGSYQVAIKLIEFGCNYKLINQAGCTPIDVAYAQGYSDLATFMDSGCRGIVPKEVCGGSSGRDQRSSDASSQLSDLELFLTGLDLLDLLPLLQDDNCITFKQLLTLTDSELEKLGITQMGNRKKILNGIHEVHKKEWSPQSFPHTREFTRYLSSSEANNLLKNVLSHTQYMTSSVVYLRKQLTHDPTCLLSSAKTDNTLTHVLSSVTQSMDQFREIYHQLNLLNSQLITLAKIPDSDNLIDQLPKIDSVPNMSFTPKRSKLSTFLFYSLFIGAIPVFSFAFYRKWKL